MCGSHPIAGRGRVVPAVPAIPHTTPPPSAALAMSGRCDSSDDDMEVLAALQTGLADAVGDAFAAERCELCGKTIAPGELSKWPMMGMRVLDKQCFNALHACSRVLAGNRDLKRALDATRESEPLKFRNMILGLRTNTKRSRTKHSLAAAFECFETLASEQSRARTQKQLLFNKRQYIAWKKLNEGATDESAARQWKDDKADSSVYQEMNKKGELTIAVDMPVELTKTDKSSTLKERRNRRGPAFEMDERANFEPSLDWDRRSGSGSSRGRQLSGFSVSTRSKGSVDGDNDRGDVDSDDDDDDDAKTPRRVATPPGSRKRSLTPARSAQGSGKKQRLAEDAAATPLASRDRASSAASVGGEAVDSEAESEPEQPDKSGDDKPRFTRLTGKVKPAAFYSWKRTFSKELIACLGDVGKGKDSKRDPLVRHTQAYESLGEQELEELKDLKFVATKASLQKAVVTIKSLAEQCLAWKQSCHIEALQAGLVTSEWLLLVACRPAHTHTHTHDIFQIRPPTGRRPVGVDNDNAATLRFCLRR